MYLDLFYCMTMMSVYRICIGEESIVTVSINENINIGTVICHFFNVIVPRPNKYSIFSVLKNRYFVVKDFDQLVVIGHIDRDGDGADLCSERSRSHSCVWKNLLLTSDGVHYVLKVIIIDENDNSPSWASKHSSLEITENVHPGVFSLELPRAKDPDDRPNDTVLYTIEPPSKYVYILNTTTISGLTPFLKLRQSFDREIINWHNVTMVAIDGGVPPRTGSLTLRIRVIDVNDNAPIFQSSIYTHSLQHDPKVDDQIDLKIKATDFDDGANGNVTYSLTLNSPFVVQKCFKVNPGTAVIVIKRPLTGACLVPEYRFDVIASDQGNPVRSAKTSIILTFGSRNIFAPDIEMSNGEPNIYIYENGPMGKHLRTVAVTDRDEGRNGQFLCGLRGNDTLERVTINSTVRHARGGVTVLQLITTGVFDRELESKISLTLVCTDLGDPPLSSSKHLIIRILDVNDNRPYFKEAFYHFKVYEENEQYQKLAQLTAYDEDEGINSLLTYHINSISNDDLTSKLSMDSNGYIIANIRLDREKYTNGVNFTVIAQDQGHPSLHGSTTVHLELLDINDHSPIFNLSHYNFSVAEDNGHKHHYQVIGQVSASDLDLGSNSMITYRISPVSPIPFKLDPDTGQLISYSLVDRETQATNYLFTVLACDNPANLLYRRTSAVPVSITVIDVNDHKPMFIFPNEANHRIQLSYNSPIGTLVTTVKASDKDAGSNAIILYSLVDPDRAILFSINQTSGQLTVSTVLNSMHEGLETVFIRASDRGIPPLWSIQQLVIEIGDYRNPASVAVHGDVDNDQVIPDQYGPTYVVVGIVLGTLVVCCALVASICVMMYRQWRGARSGSSAGRRMVPPEGHYGDATALRVVLDDSGTVGVYGDNYLAMKQMM